MKQNPKSTQRPDYSVGAAARKTSTAITNNKQANQIRIRAKLHGGGTQLNKTMPSALIYKPNMSVGDDSIYHPDIYHKPETRKKYFCDLVDSYMSKKASDNIMPQRAYQKKISMINRYQVVPEEESIELKTPLSPVRLFKVKRALTAGFSRRVATENTDLKIVSSKDTEYDFAKNINLTNKKQSRVSSIQDLKNERLNKKNTQVPSRHENKLDILKQNLKSNKNTRNYVRRQLIAQQKKIKKRQVSANKSNSSLNDSQSLDDESVNDEFTNTGIISTIQKREGKNQRIGNSRLKTMSKISTSINAFSTHSKSNHKIINLKELTELSIIGPDLEADINKRLKFINTKLNQKQWALKQMHEHSVYQVFYLSALQEETSNTKSGLKIKKFKETPEAQKVMNAVEKIKDIKVSQLWILLPKIDQTSQHLYMSPNVKSLRQELFTFMKEEKNNGEILYHIQQTPNYFKLFHNNCEYFRDIIVAVAQDLTKMKGTLINNKISLDNLYRLEEKMIQIGDWGSVAINRKLIVADKEVVFRDEPTLLIQESEINQEQKVSTKWLANPENLPPEVIQCLIGGVYSKIWEIEGCPEVWSLGIMIYQLLSCVPVSMPYLSTINHKIPKCGIFFDKQKRLTQILSNQSKMPTLVSKWMRDEKNSAIYKHIHPQIINLMKSMLQLNPKCRPEPEQIITKLRNTI